MYPYDLDAGSVRCVEATVEPDQKHVNKGAVLENSKLLVLPVVRVDGKSVSMSDEKS